MPKTAQIMQIVRAILKYYSPYLIIKDYGDKIIITKEEDGNGITRRIGRNNIK